MPTQAHTILSLTCPDRSGIVAAITQFIANHGGWIVEANQYSDPRSNWFFMRVVIIKDSLPLSEEQFTQQFARIADQYEMTWRLTDNTRNKKVMLLVSKQGHCLADLLYRWHTDELPFDCLGVISNHQSKQDFVDWYDIPYTHIPIDPQNKNAGMQALAEKLTEAQPDLIILARYMQILPKSICQQFQHRIINIHHGFLPSFVGAKPYEQAYEYGVKLVGATSHYVTADLDAGPIIEQDVIRVNHNHSTEDLIRLGRDIEKTVLARAVRYHLEDRILLHRNKTVVFADM